MSNSIYILDRELNLIIQRQYRQDLNVPYVLESFKSVYKKSYPLNIPILENNGITYIYLQKPEIIFMTPVIGDIDVMCHIAFLEKFCQLLTKYFKHYKLISSDATNVKADLIRDNYVIIYELFDECFDFGIPQLTDFNILKDYIKLMIQPEDYHDASHFNEKIDQVEKQMETEINSSISRTAMNKISWRPKGIFYNKNEFFINFNEYLKFKFNHKVHKVILNQIHGEIKCKSYLSGMPHLKLGLNETLDRTKTIFNHVQYHQCVNLNLLNGNTVEFIPPDGEFSLLSYQIMNTQVLQPLILVKPQYRIFKKNDVFKLRIKVDFVTTFKRKFSMIDLKIRIPLLVKHPVLYIDFNKSMKFKTKLGNVLHILDDECIVWKIEKVQGSMRGEMLAEFDLISEKELWTAKIDNKERGKQERNDLFYFELGSEFTKLGNTKSMVKNTKNTRDNEVINVENSTETDKNYESIRKNRMKSDIMNIDIERIVTVEFQLQNMLYSGLKVDFLSIKEDQLKLQTFPWIIYCIFCKGDDYSFVLSEDSFVNDLEKSIDTQLLNNGCWKDNEEVGDPIQYLEDQPDKDIRTTDDFTTALDHINEIDVSTKGQLDFEEYIVEEE